MIAVDTDILVRFLTKDDPVQFEKSRQPLQTNQNFVPDTVILETEWVLRFAYKFKPEQIQTAFKKLFGLPTIHPNHSPSIKLTLNWYGNGLDFADALHLAQSQHCRAMSTFDQQFFKHAKTISSCPVQEPV
ncbi:MAG: type II toxin-antitoxin system VapC family toxin [Chloroflexi bacterium]|nr:type II toxin-antitoxin system VapC family toxin [Chloroflexota bacterium]